MRQEISLQSAITRVVLGAVVLVGAGLSTLGQNGNTSEDYVKQAWELYNKENYSGAIDKAQNCIYYFQGKANDEEKSLADNHEAIPPTGDVDATQKQKIVKRGQLNDVATCYWIVGSSHEHLYLGKNKKDSKEKDAKERDAAVEAYKAGCKYKYARTLNKDQQSVWSPAQESRYGAERLGSACP
jgi:hypothetical protein